MAVKSMGSDKLPAGTLTAESSNIAYLFFFVPVSFFVSRDLFFYVHIYPSMTRFPASILQLFRYFQLDITAVVCFQHAHIIYDDTVN